MAYLYAYLRVPEPPDGWQPVDMEKFQRDARKFSEIMRRHRVLVDIELVWYDGRWKIWERSEPWRHEYGRTVPEALGNLMITHPGIFGFEKIEQTGEIFHEDLRR